MRWTFHTLAKWLENVHIFINIVVKYWVILINGLLSPNLDGIVMTLMNDPGIRSFDEVLRIRVQVNVRRIYNKIHARENGGSRVWSKILKIVFVRVENAVIMHQSTFASSLKRQLLSIVTKCLRLVFRMLFILYIFKNVLSLSGIVCNTYIYNTTNTDSINKYTAFKITFT